MLFSTQFENPELNVPKTVEEIKNASLYEVIEIVATANAHLSLKLPIEDDFAALIKVCTKLSILCDWPETLRPLNEDEKEELKKEAKKLDELMQDLDDEEKFTDNNEDLDKEYEFITEEVVRFVQIVSTDPENLTYTEKREAFRLFPKVFNAVRMVL